MFTATVFVAWLVSPAQPALAHNVWCHCPTTQAKTTLDFFHLAGEIYAAHANAVRLWHDANVPLETGVLAEFEYKLDPAKKLRPDLFRQNLQGLQQLDGQLGTLDGALGKAIDFLKVNPPVAGFNEALTKVFANSRDIRRLRSVGTRYAEVSKKANDQPPADDLGLNSVLAIFQAQREDLKMLREKLGEVIAGARDAIPLAEKGEFAQVMLSGRNAFGDKMPQLTDWFSAYDRFYVQTCMATIAVTMQTYPRGFEWLKK